MAQVQAPGNPTGNSVYILAVFNDRPYSEGVEFWFRPSIPELKRCYDEDWMDEQEMSIYVCEWGKKAERISESFDEIEGKKFPSFGQLPDTITYCRDCWIFYNGERGMCGECGDECGDVE
jgi:hypothetical protein